jgi:hypothetical protein
MAACYQKMGATAIAASPMMKKTNMNGINLREAAGADANSRQINTPHAAEIMVAP